MASITLKNVNKVYPGDVIAVSDFNLEIADEEFVILVGPSGCGKSTTLRMIAGLEEITEGEIFIADRLVNDVPPKDRDIAMVFQNYAIYPHMTVYKNMAFGLQLRKVPKAVIEEKVREAAKILDIEHLLNRKPKALSGGQRQRVALGRAMVRDPAVFLLDEPLSNLDAKLRTSMRTEITKLHKKLGTTFVYVTHDQTEAMTMGDTIVVMKDGFVQQIDTPQNLYDSPVNLFVAGFIGSPQMNFIDAVIKKSGDKFYAEIEGVKVYLPKEKSKILKDYTDKEVTLGIRPEDFISGDATGKNTIEGVVDVAELLGAEKYLYITCGNSKITARVLSSNKAGDEDVVRLTLDANRVHLFDKETEKSLFFNAAK